MRTTLGCAGMIAAVAFVCGAIGSAFDTEASLNQRLLMAATLAGATFVAAVLLFMDDYARHRRAVQFVRNELLARADVDDDEFAQRFPKVDRELLCQTRNAVARFFDAPAEKLHPTDTLRGNLRFDELEPSFHMFVVSRVLEDRGVQTTSYTFDSRSLVDIGDLARQIRAVLYQVARRAGK